LSVTELVASALALKSNGAASTKNAFGESPRLTLCAVHWRCPTVKVRIARWRTASLCQAALAASQYCSLCCADSVLNSIPKQDRAHFSAHQGHRPLAP